MSSTPPRRAGPELAREFPCGINVGMVDQLLKEKPCRLSSHQAVELRRLTTKQFGEPKVKTTAADPVEVGA